MDVARSSVGGGQRFSLWAILGSVRLGAAWVLWAVGSGFRCVQPPGSVRFRRAPSGMFGGVVSAVFVAPYLLPTTTRFLMAALAIPGVEMGLVTSEGGDLAPPGLAAFRQVEDCLDPDQLTRAVESMGPVDRLIGPLEELQVPMAQTRDRLGIEGLSTEVATNFRDKDRMKRVLSNAGLPCARHALAHTRAEAAGFARQVGFPLVAKPPAGSGSRATSRLESEHQLSQWLDWHPPEAEPLLLEEFLTGREHSFDCAFVAGEAVFWSVSRYHPTPLEVMSNSWIQWAVILPADIDDYADFADIGIESIHTLGLDTGFVHMEWFRRPDGSGAVSEAAVRPPGAQFTSLISHAHGFDLYAGWVRLMILGEFDPPRQRQAVGAVYLRGQGRGIVSGVEGLEAAQREVAGMVLEVRLPQRGDTPSSHYEGDGYVIVGARSTEEVEAAIDAILENVKVVLE